MLYEVITLTRGEFLAGKLIPYFVIGTADFLVAAAAAVWLFEVPLRGPFLGLLAVSALFLVVVMLRITSYNVCYTKLLRPSLDTPVCATSTKKFNEAIAGRDDLAVLVVSADLPFASGRFCASYNFV